MKKQNWIEKHPWWTALIGLLILYMLVFLSSDSEQDTLEKQIEPTGNLGGGGSLPPPEPIQEPEPEPETEEEDKYPCYSNIYNCDDFSTHAKAQEVFDYCKEQGRGDIHRLDRDEDGLACETLP